MIVDALSEVGDPSADIAVYALGRMDPSRWEEVLSLLHARLFPPAAAVALVLGPVRAMPLEAVQ
jgi:hypothetical protein